MPDRTQSIPYNPQQGAVQAETGMPDDYMHVQANADDFGGQIGKSIQGAGQAIDKVGDLAAHYAQIATEAASNDIIANKWAPTAAKLSGDYYKLQGKDAVDGFGPYMQNLQSARTDLLKDLPQAQANIVGSYITRHVANEFDGATRHQDQQMTIYEKQSSNAFVDSQSDLAVSAGANPDIIKQAINSGKSRILMQALNEGIHPDDANGKAIIQQQQDEFTGKTVAKVVNSAVLRGDMQFANNFYAQNKSTIPGNQQLEIDKTLHVENMRYTGEANASALVSGQPLPAPAAGATVTAARAATVDAANSAGVDPNHALAVLRTESSDGLNVGTRGDIGQTGKPAANIQEQAKNMVDELAKSKTIADAAVGGQSQPWQQYICYQQGAGGGPALLNADPNSRAIDALRPLYKNSGTALSALTGNGGNATMTCSQFLDLVKQKYETNAQRAQISLPVAAAGKPAAIAITGAAITAPHEVSGITAQTGATPVQSLIEMDKVYPDMLQRADSIPNLDEREATLKALEQRHALYQSAASAWKTQFVSQAQQLAMDPKFTSTDMIPPDMRTALADNPVTMNYLESRATYNLEHGSGVQSKDAGTYGSGIYKVMQAVHSAPDDPARITNTEQLMKHVMDGDLTFAGYDRMAKELSGKGTPEGSAEGAQQAQTFKVIKQQLSGEDMMPGMKDPKGEEIYAHAMPLVYKAIDDGKAKGVPTSELFDPQNKNWVGNAVQGLRRSPDQYYSDMSSANLGGVTTETGATAKDGQQLINDFKAGRYSADPKAKQQGLDALQKAVSDKSISRQDAMQLAVAYGYAQARPVQPPGPQVPMAGVNE